MREWIKLHKNEIVVAIVSSFIVSFIFKAGDFLSALAPKAGKSVIQSLVNVIYKTAARQNEASLVVSIFPIILGLICGVAFFMGLRGFRLVKETEEIKDINAQLNQLDPEKDEEKLKELVKRFNKNVRKPNSTSGNQLRVISIILIVLAVFIFLYSFTYIVYPYDLWQKHEISVTQIAPYTSDDEIKKIEADWVSMESKKDYDQIFEKISQIKEENHIE